MTEQPGHSEELDVDVAIVGGGLAGLSTATHLARRQRRVLCIEHRPWPRQAVGESLEFSAPALLAELGIDLEAAGPLGSLFPKTSVQVRDDSQEFTVWPPLWFAGPPIWCSRLAFHTDRTELDAQILRLALDLGVQVLPERVTAVEHDGDRITGVTTDRGTSLRAQWYVDATGHDSRLFGRSLDLERVVLGAPRIAYWTRFNEPPDGHGTKLYFPRPDAEELTWAWEIPLNPSQISVGVVLSSTEVNGLRSSGLEPRDIFARSANTIPALRRLAEATADISLSATTYVPYRHRRSIGPNWVLVGDACAMVDPLTSNGVTAALRHADQAARTITRSLDHRPLGRHRTWAFEATGPATIETLNRAIEAFLYRPTIRQKLGLRSAVTLYAATGVVTNSLYTRLNPVTFPRALACAAMLAASRFWSSVASVILAQVGALRPRPLRSET
ncbi:MAG: NAD(P)/FAD-dependent oxidoreductase [Acidimicrobiia bacterium]|nr:NAD(P)/FAD-dependent oxidoreductase [Acidimicrobiia bacterium]